MGVESIPGMGDGTHIFGNRWTQSSFLAQSDLLLELRFGKLCVNQGFGDSDCNFHA